MLSSTTRFSMLNLYCFFSFLLTEVSATKEPLILHFKMLAASSHTAVTIAATSSSSSRKATNVLPSSSLLKSTISSKPTTTGLPPLQTTISISVATTMTSSILNSTIQTSSTQASISEPTSKNLGILSSNYVASTLVATIGIGSTAQIMNVLIDTGSSLFWLRSTQCTACSGNSYNHTKSTSYSSVIPLKNVEVMYGDGTTVKCSIAQDTIILGTVPLPSQNICEASSIISNASQTDGILGLGAPQSNLEMPANIWKSITSIPNLSAMFSFYYNTLASNPLQGQAGQIALGGMDTTKFLPNTTQWVNLTSDRSAWHLHVIGVRNVTGQNIQDFLPFNATIDSGTTASYLPTLLAASLNNQIGATQVNGVYTLNCSLAATIQAFNISFGNGGNVEASITLSGAQLVYRNPHTDNCDSIIQGAGEGGVNILGSWFLRSFYTTFDYGGERIGFSTPIIGANLTLSTGLSSSSSVSTTASSNGSTSSSYSYTPLKGDSILHSVFLAILFSLLF